MIVVSNTSPITNLASIQRFDLLHVLYGEIHIADGVWGELNAYGQIWPGREEVASNQWVHQHVVKNKGLVTALSLDLDLGEAETIALAIELGADLVLLDEKSGRAHARRFDLQVAGVIGILLEAKSKQLVPTVKAELDNLRQKAGFYISSTLYQHALSLAGE